MFSITSFNPVLGQDVAEGDNIMTEDQVLAYVASAGDDLEIIHIQAKLPRQYRGHVGFFANVAGSEASYRMALGKQELVWKV